MRKQTKLVAVLSAASLLAIGASMTSFAKGWTEEDGEWVYLDSDGERVTQEWKKSGSNYYWLDEDGLMATNQIVEDDEDVYYVNESGVRAKNQWVSVENEDDVDVNGEEVETLWYYFGDNGKAYKSDDSEFKKKTVAYAGGSGTFFFDADGHMASGWLWHDGEKYYCGTENEGWAYTGWQYLEPEDDLAGEDYDDLEWFNFKGSGKMRKKATWYSKGRYYTFDANGVLENDWYTVEATVPTAASGATAYASEDGSKGTGWVYTEDPTENDSYWYYLVSITEKGKTVRSVPFYQGGTDGDYAAKVIKSKTYIFNTNGEMEDGLIQVKKATPAKWAGVTAKVLEPGYYYFNEDGGSVNGQMMTGKVAVTKDGETDYYYFNKSTGAALTNVVKDGVVYGNDGKRIQADDGNSNEIVTLDYFTEYSKGTDYVVLDDGTKVYGIDAGSQVIVSSTGKLRTSGTVKVDGVKYKITAGTFEPVEVVED